MTSLRFRRHIKLVALLALLAAVLVLGFGNQRIVAYTYQGAEQAVSQSLTSDSSLVQFDGTTADTVQILSSGADWQEFYAQ